jgi:hypothetical protein
MASSGTNFCDHNWMTVLPSADRIHGVKRGTSTRVDPAFSAFLNLYNGPSERTPKAKAEKQIECAFGAKLEAQGQLVRYQVHCEMGIADIVTSNAIYEIKAVLSRSHLRQAIAQVLAYRACINPSAKVSIVGRKCKKSDAPPDFKIAHALGVEVILWEDGDAPHDKAS